MQERRGPSGDWNADEMRTVPGKRITAEMERRIAAARAEREVTLVVEAAGESEEVVVAAFDLSDVRRW